MSADKTLQDIRQIIWNDAIFLECQEKQSYIATFFE